MYLGAAARVRWCRADGVAPGLLPLLLSSLLLLAAAVAAERGTNQQLAGESKLTAPQKEQGKE